MANAKFSGLKGFSVKTLEQAQFEKYASFHRAWTNFTDSVVDEAGTPVYQRPHVPDHFFQFAQYLVELGYVSAVQYMSRAYDFCSIVNASEEIVKSKKWVLADIDDWIIQMDRARARVKELITVSIAQAKPFRLDDVIQMAPRNAAPFLIALSSGCRPKALTNCTYNSMRTCSKTGMTRVVLADVSKDKFCDSRIIRFFCTCIDKKTKHYFCPLHGTMANFDVPIQQNVLTRALKDHYLDETAGYTAYSARRATACAIAQLAHVEEGRHLKGLMNDQSSFKARLNTQFGWCPKSEMILHYSKNHFALTLRERAFFYPLYMYVRYGVTQDERGSSFIIDTRGTAAPPPTTSDGPTNEADAKTIPIFRQPGRRVPLVGEAAIAALKKYGGDVADRGQKTSGSRVETVDKDKTAPSIAKQPLVPDGTIQPASSPSAHKKRGRKKGGTNRPKDVREAEERAKRAKKAGRPAKGSI
jgi:hypothetical protein